MQKPMTSHSSNKNQDIYLGKAVMETTQSAERVIKAEARIDNGGGVIIALVQSLRTNSDGLPVSIPAQTRDIFVAAPEAFMRLVALLTSDRVWNEVKSHLTDAQFKEIFPNGVIED